MTLSSLFADALKGVLVEIKELCCGTSTAAITVSREKSGASIKGLLRHDGQAEAEKKKYLQHESSLKFSFSFSLVSFHLILSVYACQ